MMKNCGMMGDLVGKGGERGDTHGTTPRGVYERPWAEMNELLKLPGTVRRTSPGGPVELPAAASSP